MPALKLDSPPAGLRTDARTGWLTAPAVEPSPGELWLLSWNNEEPVAALVTAAREDYVLAMPVTFNLDEAGPDEVVLEADVLGLPAVIWNRAETGLGTFLLQRRVAVAVAAPQLQSIRRSAANGVPDPALLHGDADSASTFESVAARFAELCFVEWPAVQSGERILNTDVLAAAGIDAQTFAARTGFGPAPVLALWSGETIRPEQVDAVNSALGQIAEAAVVVPDDFVIAELRRPQWKDSVARIAQHHHVDERAARELVRADVALAARTDSLSERRRTAVADAITRLLEGVR